MWKKICGIIFLGGIVYSNVIWNPFVFDDTLLISSNPFVRNLSSIPIYFRSSYIYTGYSASNALHVFYRPIVYTIFTLMYAVFGPTPEPYHILQILIHLASVVLVYLIFSRFLKRPIAYTLSLIFLVHPVNTEAVIYIADIQETLFLFFGLLAFWIMQQSESKSLSIIRIAGIVVLLTLSLLSKETGILFCGVMVLHAFLFNPKNRVRVLVSTTLPVGIYTVMRFISSTHPIGMVLSSILQRLPLSTRLLSIPKIILYYLTKIVYPAHFALIQEWYVKKIDFANFTLPLVIDLLFFAGVAAIGIYIYKHAREVWKQYIFFVAWFVIGLGLHLQIVPLDVTVSERWFYFLILGYLGMVGVIVQRFVFTSKNKTLKAAIVGVTAVIICVLSIVTIVRGMQWNTALGLYKHDLQYSPDSPALNDLYAQTLMQDNDFDQAKYYLERSVALDYMLGDNVDNLAKWYEFHKDYKKAKELYRKSLNIPNGLPKFNAYQGLIRIVMFQDKDPVGAKKLSIEGLKNSPYDEMLKMYLAISLYKTGDKQGALKTAQELNTTVHDDTTQRFYDYIQSDTLTDEVLGNI